MGNITEKFFNKQRTALFQKLEIFLFAFHQGKCVFYFLDQISVIKWFLNVIQRTQKQGTPCVFKLVIGTDQNNFYHRIDIKCLTTHGDSVQIRHLDIGDDQIYGLFLHSFNSGSSIVADMYDLCIQRFPVDILLNSLRRQIVVIYDHYFLHRYPPFAGIQS